MSFGKNLKRLRRDKGWTQHQLAKASGVKTTHIPRLENENADPKLSTNYKLVSALNCSADTLLMDSEKIGLDGTLKASLERAANLPEINKKILIDVIDKYCIAAGIEASFNTQNNTLLRVMTEAHDNALPADQFDDLNRSD